MKKVIKTLMPLYRIVYHYKPSFFLIYVIRIIAQTIRPFVNIVFPKFIIDELVGQQRISQLAVYTGLTIGCNLIFGMIINFCDETKGKYGDELEKYISRLLAKKTMTMDFEHTEDPKVLEQLEKAKMGMSWYSGGIQGMTDSLSKVITSFLTLQGVTFLLITGVPWLMAIFALSLGLDLFLNQKTNRIELAAFQKLSGLNRIFHYIYWEMQDIRFGKEVRLYGAEDMMEKKASYYNQEMVNNWKNQSKRSHPIGQVLDLVGSFRQGIIILMIAYKAMKKAITIGDINMYSVASITFYDGIKGFVGGYQELYKKVCYAYEFIAFLEYPDALHKGGKSTNAIKDHTIEFQNVSFAYPRSKDKVLTNINLTLTKGEHISVVGLNGAGKTTFIKLLCRLYDPTEGQIVLDGVDIREYDNEEYVKLIAVVFQDFQLLSFPLSENVLLKDVFDDITKEERLTWSEEEKQRLREILQQVGLQEDVNQLSRQEQTYINKQFEETGVELSGGQQQKLAIARALYKDAPIVILDEPTAALDPIAESEIYRQFHDLVSGKTAIYISHRLSSCKFCDRIYVFADGRIQESGTHQELYQNEMGLYHEMFTAQAQYYQL